MLQHFLDFRFEVVTKRHEFELAQVKKRLHILEGFEKVYDALDEMIRIIRKSDGKQDAAAKLMKRFELDAEQVDAILELKLYKLARLEILVIQKEAKEKRAEATRLAGVLKDPRKRWAVVTRRAGPGEGEVRRRAADQDRRRRRRGGVLRGGLHRRRGRPRGPHPRRLGEAGAGDEGPQHHPAPRGRRGDGGAWPGR